jgi:hypothetical protein
MNRMVHTNGVNRWRIRGDMFDNYIEEIEIEI